MPKGKNLMIKVGDRFGKWTVIVITRKDGRRQVMGRCDCGKEQVLWHPSMLSERSGCMRCTRARKNHYRWQGAGELPGTILYRIRSNARKKGWEVSVTLEYLWGLFLRQNRRCALTGEELCLFISNTKKFGPLMTASVDRIDSTRGYVEGNVQWVHKDINALKSNLPQERFIELCGKVVDFSRKG